MRKIRLSDTDCGLFDEEMFPNHLEFLTKHKDTFRCMFQEQGKPFWTRFSIVFRSFTVRFGIIKDVPCDVERMQGMLDSAFILIHDRFVDAKPNGARNFIIDIARLGQNKDKLPYLDSKSFAKDPFYNRETRDLFREFFGPPDKKSSYVKVYILIPVYLRFGGSVCRCLMKWMQAENMDPNDDSYWTPPQPTNTIVPSIPSVPDNSSKKGRLLCVKCIDDCGSRYFHEKFCGKPDGPQYLSLWKFGDPRFNDPENPLYNPLSDKNSDWRDEVEITDFQDFVYYLNLTYGGEGDQCKTCISLQNNKVKLAMMSHDRKTQEECKKQKKKNKKKKSSARKIKIETAEDQELSNWLDHVDGRLPKDEVIQIMQSEVNGAGDAVSCKGGSKGDDMVRILFTSRARVTEDFKYGILSPETATGEDDKSKNIVGGFRVVRIEDETTGCQEISITIASLKSEKSPSTQVPPPQKPTKIECPLTMPLLQSKIPDLPSKFEWHEGIGWCVAVMDYTENEARCKAQTNFTIKVTGYREDIVKRIILKLIVYVVNRKKRSCPGWMMQDDDVVTCILDEDESEEGIVISIQSGFKFQDRLTLEEKKSKHVGNILLFPGKKTLAQIADSVPGISSAGPESKDKDNEGRKMVCIQGVTYEDLQSILDELKQNEDNIEPYSIHNGLVYADQATNSLLKNHGIPETSPTAREEFEASGKNPGSDADAEKPEEESEGKRTEGLTVMEESEKVSDELVDEVEQPLKQCANCGAEEPKPKAYKKCQRCKQEGVLDARYYCGRECQVEDWTKCHKGEHKLKLLTYSTPKAGETTPEVPPGFSNEQDFIILT